MIRALYRWRDQARQIRLLESKLQDAERQISDMWQGHSSMRVMLSSRDTEVAELKAEKAMLIAAMPKLLAELQAKYMLDQQGDE